MNLLLSILFIYYFLTLLSYGLPLLAVLRPSKRRDSHGAGPVKPRWPTFVVVAPCRAAPESIPGLVAGLRAQDYPAQQVRLVIAVDSDGPSDPSAQIARAAGAEVYERRQACVRTKGASLNEGLAVLRHDPWDALVIFDIDARPEPDFLRRAAEHLQRGVAILQARPLSKNASQTIVSRIGHAAQSLADMIQRGRTRLGLSAILSGTGMVFSRASLERLAWTTATGRHTSDDGELNLRCLLLGLPITYAADLPLRNDIPSDPRGVRLQRRRWMAAYAELIPSYVWPLFKSVLRGNWRALEGTFTLLFLPSCSMAFVAGAGLGLALALATFSFHQPLGFWLAGFVLLWSLHLAYYATALRAVGCAFSWREFRELPAFLFMRAIAVVEGLLLALHPNPGHKATPAPHKEG